MSAKARRQRVRIGGRRLRIQYPEGPARIHVPVVLGDVAFARMAVRYLRSTVFISFGNRELSNELRVECSVRRISIGRCSESKDILTQEVT